MVSIKAYNGRVPVCGVFCGGCPTYTRDQKNCPGASASINVSRCEACFYHQCATSKGVSFCHECDVYPCSRYKQFAKRWTKFGQDFMENQEMIKEKGSVGFLADFNEQVAADISGEKRIVNKGIKPVQLSCAGCPHCNGIN